MDVKIVSLHTLLHTITQQLLSVYEDEATAAHNSWWIVEALTSLSKTELVAQEFIELTTEQQEKLAQWLHALVHEHKPLQYLLGTVPFLNLMVKVVPPILIPRPETEEWVANLIAQLHAQVTLPNTILDMCTGSGCIALALAQTFPESAVCAVDNNPAALVLTQENMELNNIENVYLVQSNLFEKVPPIQFNLIVANPPYIDTKEWKTLENSVKLWEDPEALVAGNQGYALIEKIITQAPAFLAPAASLVIEIGHEQGQTVKKIFEKHGFERVEIMKDLHQKDRVVRGVYNIPME